MSSCWTVRQLLTPTSAPTRSCSPSRPWITTGEPLATSSTIGSPITAAPSSRTPFGALGRDPRRANHRPQNRDGRCRRFPAEWEWPRRPPCRAHRHGDHDRMAGGSTQWQGRSVISKVVSLLDAFTPATPELTLGELADLTGLPVSTTYRLASELVEWGGLERAERSGYRIGLRLWELG